MDLCMCVNVCECLCMCVGDIYRYRAYCGGLLSLSYFETILLLIANLLLKMILHTPPSATNFMLYRELLSHCLIYQITLFLYFNTDKSFLLFSINCIRIKSRKRPTPSWTLKITLYFITNRENIREMWRNYGVLHLKTVPL